MRTMMMLTIITLMTMAIAKSEEATIDTKVKNYIVNEWNDIKEYQANAWEQGKEQNAKNWNTIKSFFTNLTNND